MELQEAVNNNIMKHLRSDLEEVKGYLENDMKRLALFEELKENNAGILKDDPLIKGREDEVNRQIENRKRIVELSKEIDEALVAEYEQALLRPNDWISSRPDVAYILMNWRANSMISPPIEQNIVEADEFRGFQKQMRSCARFFFSITGFWEELTPDQRTLFLRFIDDHLHEHMRDMAMHVHENRSALNAVYNLLGNMWDEFHNQSGEPFLISHNMFLDIMTRAVMSSLYVSQCEGIL